jgi:mannonate dehydratase
VNYSDINNQAGLHETWRWFGPNDEVSLKSIRQAGAKGIVSALHQIPHGDLWPLDELKKRAELISAAGLEWKIVESIPVHEKIKTRTGNYHELLDNYRQSLVNVAACGIQTVCYNFMPVLDWTRTTLDYTLDDGAKALRFDMTDLAVFDMYILKRSGAEADYPDSICEAAERKFASASREWLRALSDTVLMGVPGEASTTTKSLLESIEIYKDIGHHGLRENLFYFLESIMDTCSKNNIRMTIHPDDPPFDIMGLPRIASSREDLMRIITAVDHPSNGICFCTGSLGAGKNNDLPDILKAVGGRVYFAHLRNVCKEPDGSFYEASHLGGDIDMYEVVKELMHIQSGRGEALPFRPDHGHQILDDLNKTTFPGYSAIGRLKGLGELRGLAMGIQRSEQLVTS